MFTLLETVFPPVPSEVILPLAGYLSQRGSMNIVAVVVAATLGAGRANGRVRRVALRLVDVSNEPAHHPGEAGV